MLNSVKIERLIKCDIVVNMIVKKSEIPNKDKILNNFKYYYMGKILKCLLGNFYDDCNPYSLDLGMNLENVIEKRNLDNILNLLSDNAVKEEVASFLKKEELSKEKILELIVDYINYLKENDVKLHMSIEELTLKIYQCLNAEEQLLFKNLFDYTYIEEILKSKKKIKIGLFTHKSPDYDALSSTLTLGNYISQLTNPDDIEIIPVIESTEIEENIGRNLKLYSIDDVKNIAFDYAIVCDVNEKDFIYGIESVEKVAIDRRYIIDHHDKSRVELECLENNKIILPQSSSASEIVGSILKNAGFVLSSLDARNLYFGIASDSFEFRRNVSDNTISVVEYLNLSTEVKNEILSTMGKMTKTQEKLFNKIKECYCDGNLKIFTLLVPEEDGDITKYLHHKEFSDLTLPTDEIMVTYFIIGCGNNYTIKMKKSEDYLFNILDIAINNNGGGHECCCVARFNNSDFKIVLKKLLSEYNDFENKKKPKKKIKN